MGRDTDRFAGGEGFATHIVGHVVRRWRCWMGAGMGWIQFSSIILLYCCVLVFVIVTGDVSSSRLLSCVRSVAQ